MTSLLDRAPDAASTSTATANPAQRLRASMAACRVSFTWFGVQKSLTAEQRAVAAEAFDAEGSLLSAGKKLLDTKHTAFRAVTGVRAKITDYWKSLSLPFPEPGVRLVKQDKIDDFAATMADFRMELDDAVADLDRHFGELKRGAAARLGSLFNPADYPETLTGLFGVAWEFPNVEAPDYLMQLSPALYEQEQERVRGRFEEAVRLAEDAFLSEFARLVEHLSERITGTSVDGSPKIFRDSAVENLVEFFGRFRDLNVRSSDQLDELIDRAQRVVRGVGAQDLRNDQMLRRRVAGQLAQVQETLDGMLIERPRRRILRQTAGGA
jgi:hypothetical protein